MAKRFLFLAVGALALTACTSTDVPDDAASSRNVIRFENVVKKPTRGAVDLTTSSLTSFNVFGFYTMPDNNEHAHEVFNNVLVTQSGDTWVNSGAMRFWIPGVEYHFYAYSCDNKGLSEDFGKFFVDMEASDKPADKRTLEIENYVCDKTHQHDLIFASYTNYTAIEGDNDAVSFEFNHILTKLKAKFVNTFSGEYNVVIKDVTIDNICNSANYSFHEGWYDAERTKENAQVYLLHVTKATDDPEGIILDAPLTVVSKNKKFSADDKEEDVAAAKAKMTGITQAAFVIPNDYTEDTENVTLHITIDLEYDGYAVLKDKVLTATLTPVWESGCYYIYSFDLNPKSIHLNQISFSVEKINDFASDEDAEEIKPVIKEPKKDTND